MNSILGSSQDFNLDSFNIIIQPSNICSQKEKDIHTILDKLDVYKINVAEFISDSNRVESPGVRQAFLR